MQYLALHHWSNFQKNPTALGGVIAKKLDKSSLKSNFLLLQKHLKIQNLAITKATLMKLTTIMHLYKTFNLAGDWGVNHRV